MFCGNCGTKLSDDQNFCPTCGEEIKVDLMNLSKATPSPEPDSEPKLKAETVGTTAATKKLDGFFVFVLLASLLTVLIMLSTGLFDLCCKQKNDDGDSDAPETQTVVAFQDNEIRGSHKHSDDAENAIADVNSALGTAFALITAVAVAAVICSYNRWYGWVCLSGIVNVLFFVITLGALSAGWNQAVEYKSSYYSRYIQQCYHSVEPTIGFHMLVGLSIAVIIASLVKYAKSDKE